MINAAYNLAVARQVYLVALIEGDRVGAASARRHYRRALVNARADQVGG